MGGSESRLDPAERRGDGPEGVSTEDVQTEAQRQEG